MPIALTPALPVASGLTRLIFAHPADPALLIKVMRPEKVAEARRPWRWYQKRRRYRHLASFLHELREQLVICAHEGAPRPHLQNIVGLVDTDLGCGLVTEALRDRDGGYAPTLSQLVKQGRYNGAAQRDLESFIEWLRGSMIVVNDLTLGNLVYAQDDGRGARFVLIDGIGEGATLPLRSLFDGINRGAKERAIARLREKLQRKLEVR